MKQYLDLLSKILDEGVEKQSGRENMPNTIGISHGVIQMDLSEGFPLLTTKKMYLKAIILELLWFLRGDTNIKYLVDNNVNIWNGDAYRWYLKVHHDLDTTPLLQSIEEFVKFVKENSYGGLATAMRYGGSQYHIGDLGKVYGYQWRNQNGVDQVKEIYNGLKSNPYSRYHILDAWNKADFKDMALPPCHLLYQFIVRKPKKLIEPNFFQKILNKVGLYRLKYEVDNDANFILDLNMYQRSCDTFLGVPFNIASISLLNMIMAKAVGMIPGVCTWIGGDTHLYVDHIPVVEEQIARIPTKLPKMNINKDITSFDDIFKLELSDFVLSEYNPQGVLKAELFSGLKK